MSSPASALRRPPKWVLVHDHGAHPLSRAREVVRYRRLIWFFAAEAAEKLYKNTRLGWLWVLIRPLAPLLVGTIVYGGLMDLGTGGQPYFITLLVGSIAWNCFDGPWRWGSRGIDSNRDLITKLYFPRVILPLSSMVPGLAEPVINLGVLVVAALYYHHAKGVWYVTLDLGVVHAVLAIAGILAFAFGLSLWTTYWQARARDIRFILGYVCSFWMYATPVIYPASKFSERRHGWLLWFNPLSPLVEHFKTALMGGVAPPAWATMLAVLEIAAVVAGGLWYFHRVEADMADTI